MSYAFLVKTESQVLTESDWDLISRTRKGDSAAAEALVDVYWDRVFGFAFRLTQNKTDAEDIAQETFLRALRRLHLFKRGGSFKAWLFRIATHFFLDEQKAAKGQQTISGILPRSGHETPGPESVAERKEMFEEVWAGLQTLSKEQQVVVLLRGVERFEYAEIASILQVHESTARWHMYEARRILRERLGRKFGFEGQAHEP